MQPTKITLKSLLQSANGFVLLWTIRLGWDLFMILTDLGFIFCKEKADLQLMKF